MIVVHIDGACEERNPNGIGTYAYIIRDSKKEICRGSGFIGKGRGMSSNVSEYVALLNALNTLYAKRLENREIIVYTDSQVLAKQMSGEWKAVKGYYLSHYLKAKSMGLLFSNIKFQWVPREENGEADAITKKVYEDWCILNNRKPIYPDKERVRYEWKRLYPDLSRCKCQKTFPSGRIVNPQCPLHGEHGTMRPSKIYKLLDQKKGEKL